LKAMTAFGPSFDAAKHVYVPTFAPMGSGESADGVGFDRQN